MSIASRQVPVGSALFVYGTLQFPEVLTALIGRVPDHTPGTVYGWRIAALPGRVYPGLVKGPYSAPGFLITGLSEAEWRILDAFEDDFYDLTELTLTDGRTGWCYTCPDDHPVSDQDWAPADFAAAHLDRYTRATATWRVTVTG